MAKRNENIAKHKSMKGKTDETIPVAENLLGITDKDALNIAEAEGLAEAELFLLLNATDETAVTTDFVLDVQLYDWAGKWRKTEVQVGSLVQPKPYEVPVLMRQLCDDAQFRMNLEMTDSEMAELLAFFHLRFVAIHPFNNGNGRTARMLSNLLAMLKGYGPIRLYESGGKARKIYVSALRNADSGDLSSLVSLIEKEFRKL